MVDRQRRNSHAVLDRIFEDINHRQGLGDIGHNSPLGEHNALGRSSGAAGVLQSADIV